MAERPSVPLPASAPAEAQVLPNLDALRQLEDQVHTGYVRGVHKMLDQMEAAEPQCAPFVARMRSLAKQFQLETMANILKSLIAQAPSVEATHHHV